jgi:hypothetical protein
MLDHLDKLENFPVAKKDSMLLAMNSLPLKSENRLSKNRLHAEIAKEHLRSSNKIIENMLDQGDFLNCKRNIDLVKSGQNLHGTKFNEYIP